LEACVVDGQQTTLESFRCAADCIALSSTRLLTCRVFDTHRRVLDLAHLGSRWVRTQRSPDGTLKNSEDALRSVFGDVALQRRSGCPSSHRSGHFSGGSPRAVRQYRCDCASLVRMEHAEVSAQNVVARGLPTGDWLRGIRPCSPHTTARPGQRVRQRQPSQAGSACPATPAHKAMSIEDDVHGADRGAGDFRPALLQPILIFGAPQSGSFSSPNRLTRGERADARQICRGHRRARRAISSKPVRAVSACVITGVTDQ
jgi:hypothetical protein